MGEDNTNKEKAEGDVQVEETAAKSKAEDTPQSKKTKRGAKDDATLDSPSSILSGVTSTVLKQTSAPSAKKHKPAPASRQSAPAGTSKGPLPAYQNPFPTTSCELPDPLAYEAAGGPSYGNMRPFEYCFGDAPEFPAAGGDTQGAHQSWLLKKRQWEEQQHAMNAEFSFGDALNRQRQVNESQTICESIAKGQMKIDPRTNQFVPNDIFVESMGPGGALPDIPPIKKHSKYRGVTKHRRSGRWESHIWIKETGRQMYLGAYDNEEHAAEAYDIAALKVKGDSAKINFDRSKYEPFMDLLDKLSLTELVKSVKSQIPPPTRNSSNYRGVTFNTQQNLWEAKYSAEDNNQVSLGLFENDADAARAFDRAVVRLRGTSASINFKHEDYQDELFAFHQEQIEKLDSGDDK